MEQIDWCALLPAPMLPWLLSFFPFFFVVNHPLTGKRSCHVRVQSEFDGAGKSLPSSSLFFFPFAFRTAQQYGRLDLAAWHHLQEFQERRLPLDYDAQPASAHQEQRDDTLHTEVGAKWFWNETTRNHVSTRKHPNSATEKSNFYDKCAAAMQEVPQYSFVVWDVTLYLVPSEVGSNEYQYFVTVLK